MKIKETRNVDVSHLGPMHDVRLFNEGTSITLAGGGTVNTFTVGQAIELRQALDLVIAAAQGLPSITDEPIKPRVFAGRPGEAHLIPADVMKVTDADGDTWCRLDDDTWSTSERAYGDGEPLSYLLNVYGPLTEVL